MSYRQVGHPQMPETDKQTSSWITIYDLCNGVNYVMQWEHERQIFNAKILGVRERLPKKWNFCWILQKKTRDWGPIQTDKT